MYPPSFRSHTFFFFNFVKLRAFTVETFHLLRKWSFFPIKLSSYTFSYLTIKEIYISGQAFDLLVSVSFDVTTFTPLTYLRHFLYRISLVSLQKEISS